MARLTLTLLLAAFTARAAELTPISLQLKWRHQFQFAGYYMAEARGYYRDAGLDVRFIEATPGMQPIDEVLAGHAQFGVGTTDLLLYWHERKQVVALAAIFQHSPIALMTLGSTGRPVSSLKGKKVMVEPDSAELTAFLSREGLGLVDQVEHSFDPIDLIEGRVEAMSVYVTDEPWTLSRQGVPYALFSPRSAGIDFYGDTLFTTERYLAAHPDQVSAFREASLRGWREAMANPEAAIELILQRSSRKSRAQLRFEAGEMAPLLQFDLVEPGYMSVARWRHIADVYTEAGLLPQGLDLEGFTYAAPVPTPRWVVVALASLIALALMLAVGAAAIAQSNRRTRESEARFRTLFERSADPCFLIRDGKIIDCNLAASQALGFRSIAELVGLQPLDLSVSNQADDRASRELAASLAQALREGVHRFEWDLRHVDGHAVPMRITLARMRLDGSDALFASAQDISKTRELEVSLRKASDEAGAASRLKSQFLANMSHEVRTPLAAIMGVAELGKSTVTLDEAKELFAMVGDAGHTLLSLANDLLDVSRLDAGRMRIEEGPVDVHTLVARAVGLIEAQATAKGLTLKCQFVPEHPVTVRGDRARLGQVLTNLLSNAVKFTEVGGVTVQAMALDGELRLSVVDTGVGLSAAQQGRLFLPFSQVDESATRRHGGAGLGLALSRQITRLMGGELTLESAPGRGSTFTCTVPAPVVDQAGGEAVDVDSSAVLASLRVLVVEDNKVNQLVASSMLHKAGAVAEIAENGRQAIARLERGPTDFDVVLMDLQMPELDGLETTRELRRRAQFEKTPIVALTAHALEEERLRCLAAGMNGYLSKPIEVTAFYATLRLYVRPAASPGLTTPPVA